MIRNWTRGTATRIWTFQAHRKNVSTFKGPLPASPRAIVADAPKSFPSKETLSKDSAYIFQPGQDPLDDRTLGMLLGSAAEEWADRECLVSVYENTRLTFKDAIRRADKLAAGLMKLGMKRGDRFAVWGPNDIGWFIAAMCSFRAGFILVTINPAYQMDELVHCLQKVAVKAVLSPDTFKTQNYPKLLLNAKRWCPTLEHIVISSRDHVTGTHRFVDVEALASNVEVERIAAEQSAISCDDGCNIQFTSGTTGKPKGTLLSHRSLRNNTKQASKRTEITHEQRICLNVPFFHIFGLHMGHLTTFQSGCTLVLESRSFDPVKSLEAIVREKCDVLYGTPTMWINLLDAHARLNPPTQKINFGAIGGSPVSPQLYQRIAECFRFDNMKTIYGLTETTGIIFQSLPGEDKELTRTTVGHVSDHIEAMVVDQEGSPVSFGSPGELWVRGYSSMMSYWDDEVNTKKTITEDGWLKTGDQFILRADGYGHVIGRLKDMLIRGGENIFPKEIEDFLMTHPSIVEAQVIGAFDPVYGEEVCACVRLKNGSRLTKDDLKQYCRGKISHFKIPRYIEFVDEYPKTASGKVQKFQLRIDMEASGVIPKPPNTI